MERDVGWGGNKSKLITSKSSSVSNLSAAMRRRLQTAMPTATETVSAAAASSVAWRMGEAAQKREANTDGQSDKQTARQRPRRTQFAISEQKQQRL